METVSKKPKREKFNEDMEDEQPQLEEGIHRRTSKMKQDSMPKWIKKQVIVDKNFTMTVEEAKLKWGLNDRLMSTLQQDLDIKSFFPIQSDIIPRILENSGNLYKHSGEIEGSNKDISRVYDTSSLDGLPGVSRQTCDICVSAPTGSGKTLAYAIPIVQTLLACRIRKIRAIIVVPTRELASQVYEVFHTLIEKSRLELGVVKLHGQTSFAQEQRDMFGSSHTLLKSEKVMISRVDIVVCTPGRLVDHIKTSRGFCLSELRYLVIDEADRLLSQSFQEWLSIVNTAIGHGRLNRIGPVQKLLFSATMTRNPGKIAELNLYAPVYISSGSQVGNSTEMSLGDSRYAVAVTLRQFYVPVSRVGDKPLALLYLLCQHFSQSEPGTATLCFLSSKDSAHRLWRLLDILGVLISNSNVKTRKRKITKQTISSISELLDIAQNLKYVEHSASLTQIERSSVLNDVKKGVYNVTISSDSLARGIDLDNIGCVISYDMPSRVKTYIHRIGRTARAGQEGVAFSIMHRHDVNNFKNMASKISPNIESENAPQQYNIPDILESEPLLSLYQQSLSILKHVINLEAGGKIASGIELSMKLMNEFGLLSMIE